jgi:hypothetical protein
LYVDRTNTQINRNQKQLTEYDSNYEVNKRMDNAKHNARMLEAHAELLDFIANVSDDSEEDDGKLNRSFLPMKKDDSRRAQVAQELNTSITA